jgi:fibronectin-binding autotransporter adhesin
MLVHGCISGTAVVDGATAVLGGNGLVNDVVVTNGATLAADTLSAQSVTLYPDCHFAVTLNGTQAQTQYNQLLARSGTLTLGDSTLDLTLGYAPAADTTFTIIKNESGNPVTGTFAGLPEGAMVSVPYDGRGYVFKIRYNVGAGGDVVLERMTSGTIWSF